MQVDGYSLDAQRDKLRKYAAYEDMIVAGEYSDEGFSGKNIQGRQEFQRMLNDIQDGKDGVSYVLVFKLSRFGRNAAFTSRDIGQIGTYVNIVDDLVKTDFDAKTIGLIICKSKNNILAKYAVNSSKEPIGISEYKLSNLLPVEYRASMPTIEEIENELR